jgi:hypothetical protein
MTREPDRQARGPAFFRAANPFGVMIRLVDAPERRRRLVEVFEPDFGQQQTAKTPRRLAGRATAKRLERIAATSLSRAGRLPQMVAPVVPSARLSARLRLVAAVHACYSSASEWNSPLFDASDSLRQTPLLT